MLSIPVLLLTLTTASTVSPKPAGGMSVTPAESGIIKTKFSAIPSDEFLRDLVTTRKGCRATSAKARALAVQNFPRIYFKKTVEIPIPCRLVSKSETRKGQYAQKIREFRFCDVQLERPSGWQVGRDGLGLLVFDLRVPEEGPLSTLRLEGETLGETVKFELVAGGDDVKAQIEKLAVGTWAKVELLVLGMNENEIHGLLLRLDETAGPTAAEVAPARVDPTDELKPAWPTESATPVSRPAKAPVEPILLTPISIIPSELFTLRIGEWARLGESSLRVRFLDVVRDDRCPKDVTCALTGNARVRLAVRPFGEKERDVELDYPASASSEIPVDGHWLRVVGLHPRPDRDGKVDKGSYRCDLVLSDSPASARKVLPRR